MLKVKITNPTNIGRSYAWVKGGLRLGPGESTIVSFDPFTAAKNQCYVELCNRDLKLGFVSFTYIVEAPCKVSPDAIVDKDADKVVKKVTKEEPKVADADPSLATIKPALEEVSEKKEVTPLFEGALGDTDTPQGKVSDPEVVNLFDRAKLKDDTTFEVGAPKIAVATENNDTTEDSPLEVTVANEPTKKRGRAKKVEA